MIFFFFLAFHHFYSSLFFVIFISSDKFKNFRNNKFILKIFLLILIMAQFKYFI